MPLPLTNISMGDLYSYYKVNTGGSYAYYGPGSLVRMLRCANNSTGEYSYENLGAATNYFASVSFDGVRSKSTVFEYYYLYHYWDSRNPACCRMNDGQPPNWSGTREQHNSETFSYWYGRGDGWKVDASHSAGYYSYRLNRDFGGAWGFDGNGQIMWTAGYVSSGYNSGGGAYTVTMWAAPYDPDVYTNSGWSNRYALAQYYKRLILYPVNPAGWGDNSTATIGFYMSRYRVEWYVHGNDWGYCTGAYAYPYDRYAYPNLQAQSGYSNTDLGYGWWNGSGPFYNNYNNGGNVYIGWSRGRSTVAHIEQMAGGTYGYMSGWIFMALYTPYFMGFSEMNELFRRSANSLGYRNN
jgi:hypothetical protein